MKVSKTGYRKNSKDKSEKALTIPGDRISMKSVEFPVIGVDNMGRTVFMKPGGEYNFPGASHVMEFPVRQMGGAVSQDYVSQVNSFTPLNEKQLRQTWEMNPSFKGKPFRTEIEKGRNQDGTSFYNYYYYDSSRPSSPVKSQQIVSARRELPKVADPMKQVGYNGVLNPVVESYQFGGGFGEMLDNPLIQTAAPIAANIIAPGSGMFVGMGMKALKAKRQQQQQAEMEQQIVEQQQRSQRYQYGGNMRLSGSGMSFDNMNPNTARVFEQYRQHKNSEGPPLLERVYDQYLKPQESSGSGASAPTSGGMGNMMGMISGGSGDMAAGAGGMGEMFGGMFEKGGVLNKFMVNYNKGGTYCRETDEFLTKRNTVFVDYISSNTKTALLKEAVPEFFKSAGGDHKPSDYKQMGGGNDPWAPQIDPTQNWDQWMSDPTLNGFVLPQQAASAGAVNIQQGSNFRTSGPFGPYGDSTMITPTPTHPSANSTAMQQFVPTQYQSPMGDMLKPDNDKIDKATKTGKPSGGMPNLNELPMLLMQGYNRIYADQEALRKERWLEDQMTIENMATPDYGSRGDYDVNQGNFRPNQMVPSRKQGGEKKKYKKGGTYNISDADIPDLISQGIEFEFIDD